MVIKKRKLGAIDFTRLRLLRYTFFVVVIFLYAPLLQLIAFSFNDSKRNIHWNGFTTKYYVKAFLNDSLREAFLSTIFIAVTASIISTIFGLISAYVLWRFKLRVKLFYEGIIAAPLILPEICMGISMFLFFNMINWPTDLVWPFNFSSVILAHIVFSFPFATVIIRSRFMTFNKELEESAMDLGANNWQIFRDIILSYVKPAIITSLVLCFTLSLDDFLITFFVATPENVTLPLKIYSMVRFGVTPEVNAGSSVLIFLTVLLVSVVLLYQLKIDGKLGKKRG